MKKWTTRIVLLLVAGVLVFGLVRAFRQVPVLVDVATLAKGQLQVTADDDGRTRVRERYTISAPIQGRLLRTTLDPGDDVKAGDTVVAEFVPIAPHLLDTRSRAEAKARLLRAEADLRRADALREQMKAEADYASKQLVRARDLHAKKIRPIDDLQKAERDERRAREGLRAAELAAQVAHFEKELAKATLQDPAAGEVQDPPVKKPDSDADAKADAASRLVNPALQRRIRLRSPIDGRVLRVFEESARALKVGAPILEVGNTKALEVVADYLTQAAVKVRPGMLVFVGGWGGKELRGLVRVVEPGGFTKVSALGVEEQRVNIIVDPDIRSAAELEQWAALGDSYRVELRIMLLEKPDVLIVPTGALFRRQDDWAVFLVEDGIANVRRVRLGDQNDLEAEVVEGLSKDDVVVLYPSELLQDGARVEVRK